MFNVYVFTILSTGAPFLGESSRTTGISEEIVERLVPISKTTAHGEESLSHEKDAAPVTEAESLASEESMGLAAEVGVSIIDYATSPPAATIIEPPGFQKFSWNEIQSCLCSQG